MIWLISVIQWLSNLYLLCLSDCLFVCLYPKNVKTAEPIGPKFFVEPHVTTGMVYGWSNFQKFASNKIRFFKLLKNSKNLFYKIYNVYKEKMFTIEKEDGRTRRGGLGPRAPPPLRKFMIWNKASRNERYNESSIE